ncbi:hypothetical protein F441_06091 [Phytophthora nicotianae CJ01A1]|uniref:HTH araC/xylS-type domain-containing protein n=5 Tax=Phytophthora nicotianae TaxID=4792 RepID=V9FHW3_PHYNI|nr:hypothetical protein F443_06083 [Phytophthora nicotianae P1569]ETK90234.1 hypothetical protein L915_05959 [Phytophthora nicotianae]ETO79089.1 hypothetical protein F444_06140 [Phytophthora nicotianae P1976]ETP20129.1 hypothetical protein F441_06091 [Phytophthora nicotianae CJ01A1]ETP48069.1 hypothetical protein F442_06120 [Phytophthora nicotianae P10297]
MPARLALLDIEARFACISAQPGYTAGYIKAFTVIFGTSPRRISREYC